MAEEPMLSMFDSDSAFLDDLTNRGATDTISSQGLGCVMSGTDSMMATGMPGMQPTHMGQQQDAMMMQQQAQQEHNQMRGLPQDNVGSMAPQNSMNQQSLGHYPKQSPTNNMSYRPPYPGMPQQRATTPSSRPTSTPPSLTPTNSFTSQGNFGQSSLQQLEQLVPQMGGVSNTNPFQRFMQSAPASTMGMSVAQKPSVFSTSSFQTTAVASSAGLVSANAMHTNMSVNTGHPNNPNAAGLLSPSHGMMPNQLNMKMEIGRLQQQIQKLYALPQSQQIQQLMLDLQERVRMMKAHQQQQLLQMQQRLQPMHPGAVPGQMLGPQGQPLRPMGGPRPRMPQAQMQQQLSPPQQTMSMQPQQMMNQQQSVAQMQLTMPQLSPTPPKPPQGQISVSSPQRGQQQLIQVKMSEPKEKIDISDLKDTFLECPVCVEHFNQTDKRPRLLHSCLHAFCTQCLQQLVLKEGKGQITCPLCRHVQNVTGKIETLPLDPVRSKLVDYISFHHKPDEDGSRAEASFRYTVKNISKLKDTALSPPCMVRNLPWKIMAMPRYKANAERQKNLGFFLQCNANTDSTTWSCHAVAELRIISQRTEGEAFTRKIQHLFCCTENDYGYSEFIYWAELLNPDKGYVKDDKVILEVHVTADAPQRNRQLDAHKRWKRLKVLHSYRNVQVLLEDSYYGHQGNDLFDVEKVNVRNFKVKNNATLEEFLELLAENLKYPVKQIRPWPFRSRQNQTFRPTILDIDAEIHKTIHEIADYENPWYVFVETLSPGSVLKELPPFDINSDVLLFLKLYDPRTKSISYCGHIYVPISTKGVEIVPELNRKAGFPPTTSLIIFEEVKPNLIERLEELNQPIDKLIEELMDGDILVFQQDEPDLNIYQLPTVKDYFRLLVKRSSC